MHANRLQRYGTALLLAATPVFVQGSPPLRPAAETELEGLIEPYVTVNLSAAVDGLIEAVEVRRGDFVKKGQVVARLEASVERLSNEIAELRATSKSQIQRAEARLAVDRRSRERLEDLYRRNVVSMGDLDQARGNEELAAAELLAARETRMMAEADFRRSSAQLALRTIRSPVEGVIVERFLSEGEFVGRSIQVQIVQVAQIDPLRVEVLAPLSLLGAVSVGDEATVYPEEPAGGAYDAEVTVVDTVIDAASGTFRIRLELPNPEHRIPAGLKCGVRFRE